MNCLNCGLCCQFIINGKITFLHCDYLIKNKFTNITSCMIYDKKYRVGILSGTINNKKVHCNLRKDTPFDYFGCPYNTNKPIIKDLKIIELKGVVNNESVKCVKRT